MSKKIGWLLSESACFALTSVAVVRATSLDEWPGAGDEYACDGPRGSSEQLRTGRIKEPAFMAPSSFFPQAYLLIVTSYSVE